ncbi:DUF3307 domain-containing protein [Streptococcus uberis]|uniref:DUF3307 domain-containing protein n=1 Tax=Streptococcus uberis TaxID=1349 RepID=UPI001FF38E27|nr:DUF3307 domain-containing protein [Streptococcus uberis]MCK1212087.1 DUF3307 domain-containing protein [Streptococcus uberis]MCK1243770.1 DUF3307 domain-containing protein [Streptococcus uberis]
MPSIAEYLKSNPLLLLLLICHFLADFHFQSPQMAEKKLSDKRYLLKHILLVGVTLMPLFVLIPNQWLTYLIIWLSHAVIDLSKSKFARLLKLNIKQSFILDQLFHLTIIASLAVINTHNYSKVVYLDNSLLTTALFIILITKPSNILFKILFEKYQPAEGVKLDTISGAGAMIGTLERIVIGICMVMGQYASIGLVFTAKSIARYNKISESPAFAEYYLIGSLFSILSVFLAYCICF